MGEAWRCRAWHLPALAARGEGCADDCSDPSGPSLLSAPLPLAGTPDDAAAESSKLAACPIRVLVIMPDEEVQCGVDLTPAADEPVTAPGAAAPAEQQAGAEGGLQAPDSAPGSGGGDDAARPPAR